MPRGYIFFWLSAGVVTCLSIGYLVLVPPGPAEGRSLAPLPLQDQAIGGLSLELGKVIYGDKCAPCHGLNGKGDGPAAVSLNVRPRDFTSGIYKLRTTASGSIPTDDDLARSTQAGIHGTSMPDWGPFLSGDSLRAVIEYIKSFSPRFKNEQPVPLRVGRPVASSARSIAAGWKEYQSLQCGACHGIDGKGTGATATDLVDDLGNDIVSSNLTEPWTFRGGSTSRDIYLRFVTGMDGTPMPSYAGTASDEDFWNLTNYIVSLARRPVWSMNERELAEFYARLDSQAVTDPVKRGKYLVESVGCAECHSPMRDDGSIVEELRLAGGMRWRVGPYGDFFTRNLTSDKESGLGNWTDEEIKRAITKGVSRDGRRFMPFPMPWISFASFKEEDLDAIVAYLRTVPPVYNKIPDPQPLNIASYLWGKFKMLILGEDFPTELLPGNAGSIRKEAGEAGINSPGGPEEAALSRPAHLQTPQRSEEAQP